ncbi:uncharacterized protein OCT59_004587 [Rhizophagus irregularis]|uniref:Uncharacterized protein n=1 Tax=Rhizophagus irregularis (strain DAOM 197198w) TaxID=1432141 RepID=A0A015IFW3_RHIIW|nr:hypothetical protein RirG_249030 [Rhizophagus irregularis DAOM 197198w]UZO13081.1 hypothetical protein OCT59_004587 [Rhizophagus irregularis]
MDNKSEKLLENEKLSAETTDDDEPALDLDINVLQQHASRRLNRHCICARRLTRGLLTKFICYNSKLDRIASPDSHAN